MAQSINVKLSNRLSATVNVASGSVTSVDYTPPLSTFSKAATQGAINPMGPPDLTPDELARQHMATGDAMNKDGYPAIAANFAQLAQKLR